MVQLQTPHEGNLEAFSATEFNEIILGREPRQNVKFLLHFGH